MKPPGPESCVMGRLIKKNGPGHRVKIVFLGASHLFVHQVVRDLSLTRRFTGSEIVIYDIDRRARQRVARVCRLLTDRLDSGLLIKEAGSLPQALAGADFVLLCITVGGKELCARDIALCRRYGMRHVIGDSAGPACVFRELRSVPALLRIGKVFKEICPTAWLINFSNPMSVMTSVLANYAGIKAIGLCQGTNEFVHSLARAFKAKPQDVRIKVAGVNHHAYITQAKIKGEDVLPL